MAIDNKPNAGKIKLLYLIVPFMFTIIIAVLIFLETFESYFFLLVLALIFVLIIIYLNKLKLRFILFDIKDDKILLRYHGLGPIGATFKSIEFPAKQLVKFELVKAFGGLRKELILYQKTKKGIAKYPAVSMAAMKKNDLEKILATLSNVLKLNKV